MYCSKSALSQILGNWSPGHFVEDSKGEPLGVHNVITVQVCDFVDVFLGGLLGFYVGCLINPGLSFCRGPVCCPCFAYRWLTHVDSHSLMHSESFRYIQMILEWQEFLVDACFQLFWLYVFNILFCISLGVEDRHFVVFHPLSLQQWHLKSGVGHHHFVVRDSLGFWLLTLGDLGGGIYFFMYCINLMMQKWQYVNILQDFFMSWYVETK